MGDKTLCSGRLAAAMAARVVLLAVAAGAVPVALAASSQNAEVQAVPDSAVVAAAEVEVGGFAREMPPGAPMGAAYLTLQDHSGKVRVLTRVELPAHPQGSVVMHTTFEVDGVSRMRALEEITLPGNGTFEMRPGATHLMVQGVALRAGDTLPLKLVFADGTSVRLELPVRGRSNEMPDSQATQNTEDHHHHHG